MTRSPASRNLPEQSGKKGEYIRPISRSRQTRPGAAILAVGFISALVVTGWRQKKKENNMASSQLYKWQMVPVATPAAVGTAGQRVMAVLLYGGSAASSVEFKNAATDTGTVLLSLNCIATDSKFVDLSSLGGITFDTGIFCKPAGTVSLCYVCVG